jgi:hypothetical protein
MINLFSQTKSSKACGGCAVKSDGNCSSHLTSAAKIIVEGFVEAQTIFDHSNAQHIEIVATILAQDLRDDKGAHVAYEVPQEPHLQKWFFGLIAQNVKAGLGVASPAQ